MIKEIKRNRLYNTLKSNILLLEKSKGNGHFVGLYIGNVQYAFYTSYNRILKFYFYDFINYCGVQDDKETKDLLLVLLYQNITFKDRGFTIVWK